MNLESFALGQEPGYTQREIRKCSINFFSGLANDSRINQEQWGKLIKFGDQIYYTTFTDDSDYNSGGMDFSAIGSLPTELRREVLDYVSKSGNWIVKNHVRDYVEGNSKEPRSLATAA